MMRHVHVIPVLVVLALSVWTKTARGQGDSLFLPSDDLFPTALSLMEDVPAIDVYEPLNATLGGDSVRLCNGYGCMGWVEDHYPDGTLKHRGYYKDGQLLVYKNYHPDGVLEREFRIEGNTRSSMRTYHPNGAVHTENEYVRGLARSYTEHYPTGTVRYAEEKHAKLPYYTLMDLFAPNGQPISTLHQVDKKRGIFEQREYWPNGRMRASGRSQFDPLRYDSMRIGSWTYYDEQGTAVKEERYLDGKVHELAVLK